MSVRDESSAPPVGRDTEMLRGMVDRLDPKDPGAFNNLGVLYYSKGLYADAVNAFLRALAIDARMRAASRNLEIAAAKPSACDVRLAQLAAQLREQPDDRALRREHARLLRMIGRTADATRALDALISEDPDDGASLFERGLIEQRAGDLRRAQRWLERAVQSADRDPIARLHLAEVLYQRGLNEQALLALDAAIELDNTIADAHLLRGFVLGDMGRHEAAMAAATLAAELNPSIQSLQPDLSLESNRVPEASTASASPEGGLARYGLGLAFRQRGYFDEARREFQRALLQGEDAQLARHAIAELDVVGGMFANAKRAFEGLLLEYPTHSRYWNELGVALHQGGDLPGAVAAYQRALRCDPRSPLAYNNLGVALFDLDDASGAKDALSRAMELDPSAVVPRTNLAMWYRRRKEPLAALGLLRELVAFQSHDADAWHALGLVCVQLDWQDEARGAFARAVEERPGHAEARYSLAQMLAADGDEDGALRETQQAMGLAPVRIDARMRVAIDLQRECPEACGPLDLLSLRQGDPLVGVALSSADVATLLPEQAVEAAAAGRSSLDDVVSACDEAERHSARGMHGEALDRFTQAIEQLDVTQRRPDAPHYAVWRRAAIGQARALCLLKRGAEALSVLKTLGSHNGHDAEVLALFACSAAACDPAPVETVRTAIVRLLRIEHVSAALMHFAGDSAVSIADDGLALACYRRALSLDPNRPSPRVAIARLLRLRGDLLAARLELVAALSLAPQWREAVLELAQVHRDADRPHDVLMLLSEHLQRHSADLNGLVLLAETLIRLDQDANARVAVTRVLRHEPNHLHGLWLDGVLLARQSRLRDARDRWRLVAEGEGDQEIQAKARRAIAKADIPLARKAS